MWGVGAGGCKQGELRRSRAQEGHTRQGDRTQSPVQVRKASLLRGRDTVLGLRAGALRTPQGNSLARESKPSDLAGVSEPGQGKRAFTRGFLRCQQRIQGSTEVRQAFTQDGAAAEMIAVGCWLQTETGQTSKRAERNGSQFVMVREGVFTNLGKREN